MDTRLPKSTRPFGHALRKRILERGCSRLRSWNQGLPFRLFTEQANATAARLSNDSTTILKHAQHFVTNLQTVGSYAQYIFTQTYAAEYSLHFIPLLFWRNTRSLKSPFSQHMHMHAGAPLSMTKHICTRMGLFAFLA
jgi:hypothetical protein